MRPFYYAMVMAIGFSAVLMTGAYANTQTANNGDAWALAHAIQTEAHEPTPEGVANAVLERAASGRYGPKGNVHATVWAKKQFSGPKKLKPWNGDSATRARWNRTLAYAEKALATFRSGGSVLPAKLQHLKGCRNFDNVMRTDLGAFCGKYGGNYFFKPRR